MASGSPAVIVAVVCTLLAALAHARGWRIGAWLAAAGAMVLAGALVARGLKAGYWPLTGEYEFALAFALGTLLAALVATVRARPTVRPVQAIALLIATLLLAYGRLLLPGAKRAIRPLLPALDSVWLPLHVGVAALAYGALALAGAAGVVWLLSRGARGETPWVMDRAIAAGYPLLTLALIFGMIWAQVAWGRYWGWDLKEVWTLVTWLVYGLYWHVRTRPRWQGLRLAWLAIAGLAAVMVTFLGVGWLARAVGLESLHLF
jgi:ABC-type transport system involved in cytochrome c biogenesis permease subunit